MNPIEEYRKKFGTKQIGTSSAIEEYQKSRGIKPRRPDLTTSEGLYSVARGAGGAVSQRADEIMDQDKSILSTIGGGLKKGLGKVLDVAQRPNYAIASGIKNTIDADPNTTFFGGLASGITGRTKHTFSDVFEEAGWQPDSKMGKFGRGLAGFALDVLLDPTTYVTFGASAGTKVAIKGSTKTLSKEGQKLLAKGMALPSGKEFGEDFVKKAISNMAQKSPELYKKFIDQGGVKFFGNTLISGGRIAGVAKAIPGMSKLDTATLPIRNQISAMFNRDASAQFGKVENLGQVSETGTGREFVQLSQRFRDLGKTRSQDGLNQAVEIARANNLTYQEARIITDAIEAKLPIANDRLENVRRLMEQTLGRNLKAEQRAGIEIGEIPNYVPHILVDTPVRNIPFVPTGPRVTLGASKGRTIDGTISEINEAFGKEFFDENIVNAVAIRSVASARAVTAKEFLTEAAQKFGTQANRAPLGYVEIPIKELKGLKFHPAIAEQIGKFKGDLIGDEATNNFLKAFDKMQNFWKASVTSIFPAFHGRNAISNVFQNYLDLGLAAISPSKNALSATMLAKNKQFEALEKAMLRSGDNGASAKALKKLSEETVLTDDLGKVWTFGELRKEIRERGVAFSDQFTGFLDIREDIAGKLGKLSGETKTFADKARPVNPFSQQNVAFKAGRSVANTIEQQARILNFMTNLERTGDVIMAAERTKMFLFDYNNLSSFEKNIMRRLVPFYTWTRKNIELQATQLARQPGKLASQAKLFSNTSKLLSGSVLSDEEKKNLPEFLQEGLGIVFSRDGDDVEIVGNFGTPLEAIFSTLKPNALLGSMSPVIAVPLQTAIGKHFFFDRDLEEVNDAKAYQKAPQFIKDYIGFTEKKRMDGSTSYVATNPTRLFILNNIPPSSRVVGTIGQLEDENLSGKLKTLRFFTGLRPYGANLSDQEMFKEKEKIRELQDLLDETGIAPIFQRSFIPKDN